jgi:hypothetical protein
MCLSLSNMILYLTNVYWTGILGSAFDGFSTSMTSRAQRVSANDMQIYTIVSTIMEVLYSMIKAIAQAHLPFHPQPVPI